MQNSQWTGFVYFKDQQSTNDYYPFGSQLPNRGFDAGSYKFGFNGKENDDEVYGDGNFQDYGMRMYDTRVGRFMGVDPLTKDYPWYTPYQFAGNKPIIATDLDGEEESIAIWNKGENNKMNLQTYVKWSTLYPGQENGPLGPGTATIIRQEIGNAKGCYSTEVSVQFSRLNTQNKVEMYKGLINTTQGQSFMQTMKNWDAKFEGGANGDPGYNNQAQNGSIQIEGNLIAGYGISGSIGYNWDIQGNSSISFSFSQGWGFDISISAEIQDFSSANGKVFDIKNLSGEGESISGGWFAGYSRIQNIDRANNGAGNVYTGNSTTFSFPFSPGGSLKRGWTTQIDLGNSAEDSTTK